MFVIYCHVLLLTEWKRSVTYSTPSVSTTRSPELGSLAAATRSESQADVAVASGCKFAEAGAVAMIAVLATACCTRAKADTSDGESSSWGPRLTRTAAAEWRSVGGPGKDRGGQRHKW